ncbi:unnamed protein product [Caretta caretta]
MGQKEEDHAGAFGDRGKEEHLPFKRAKEERDMVHEESLLQWFLGEERKSREQDRLLMGGMLDMGPAGWFIRLMSQHQPQCVCRLQCLQDSQDSEDEEKERVDVATEEAALENIQEQLQGRQKNSAEFPRMGHHVAQLALSISDPAKDISRQAREGVYRLYQLLRGSEEGLSRDMDAMLKSLLTATPSTDKLQHILELWLYEHETNRNFSISKPNWFIKSDPLNIF